MSAEKMPDPQVISTGEPKEISSFGSRDTSTEHKVTIMASLRGDPLSVERQVSEYQKDMIIKAFVCDRLEPQKRDILTSLSRQLLLNALSLTSPKAPLAYLALTMLSCSVSNTEQPLPIISFSSTSHTASKPQSSPRLPRFDDVELLGVKH